MFFVKIVSKLGDLTVCNKTAESIYFKTKGGQLTG